MFSKSTIIPIEICHDALMNKKFRALQVYVWLKMNCSGKIKITQELLENMATDIDLKSVKTIKSNIGQLQNRKWISKSYKSDYYFVKGFESIRLLHNFWRRAGVEFLLKDIKKFKGFLIAAIIGHLINVQKRRLKAVELSKGSSKTSAFKQSFFYPVANEALAKILGISISTAFEWKKLAEKQGYIKIKKNSRVIDFVQPQFLNDLKKYGDIPAQKIWAKKGKVCEQLPDKVNSMVTLRRRRKIIA